MLSRRTALAASLGCLPSLVPRLGSAASQSSPAGGRIRLPSGRCLGYAEFGDPAGPLVLYFHGTPGSRVEAGLIHEEALAAPVRLVAVDRPGMGLSTYQSGRRIVDWPVDVEAFVAALGYGGTSFGVIGLSGGAPYALVCAKCIPHRLTHSAVVSGHTPPGAPVARGNQDKTIDFAVRRPRLARIGFNASIRKLHRQPDRMLQKVAESWSAADRRLIMGNPRYRALLIHTLNETVRQGAEGPLTGVRLLGSPWGFRLADIAGVTVSIWQGGCDPIAPPSMGRYFQNQIVGSELIIDPQAGHLTMAKWHAAEVLSHFV